MQLKQSQIPYQLQAHRVGAWVVLSHHYTEAAATKKIRAWKANSRSDEELRIVKRGLPDFITTPRSYAS